MAKLALKYETEINGKMVNEIEYDLESLQGDSVQLAVKELAKREIIPTVLEIDTNYHAMIFAIAAGLAFEDIQKLKVKDYNKVCTTVRDFFLNE